MRPHPSRRWSTGSSPTSYAEILTKAMGYKASEEGSWSAGLAALSGYLKGIGVDTAKVRQVDGYAAQVGGEADAMAERWRPREGEVVELVGEMHWFALRMVGRILFGTDVEKAFTVIEWTMPPLQEYSLRRGFSPLKAPRGWPTPANRRAERLQGELYALCDEIVESRRGVTTDDDLVSLLVHAGNAEDGSLDAAELREQVLIFAGTGNPRTGEWTDLARRLFEGRGIRPAPPAPPAAGAEEFQRVMAKSGNLVLAIEGFPAMPGTVLRPLVDPVPLSVVSLVWRKGLVHPGIDALRRAAERLAVAEGWLRTPPEGAWIPAMDMGLLNVHIWHTDTASPGSALHSST